MSIFDKFVNDKIIEDQSVRKYFLDKKYKKIGFFTYTKKKMGVFFKNIWSKNVIKEYLINNISTLLCAVIAELLIPHISSLFPQWWTACMFLLSVLVFSIFIFNSKKTLFLPAKAFAISFYEICIKKEECVDLDNYLDVEDHKIMSKLLRQKDFVLFLKHFKKYKDIPLKEMKKYEENLKIKAEKSQKELQIEIKEKKIKNYADSFYK